MSLHHLQSVCASIACAFFLFYVCTIGKHTFNFNSSLAVKLYIPHFLLIRLLLLVYITTFAFLG